MVLGGTLIVQALCYYGVLKINTDHLIGSVYSLLMSIFIWIIFGLVIISLATRRVNKWR